MMSIVTAFIVIILLSVMLVPFLSVSKKWIVTVTAVIALITLSSIPAVQALWGTESEWMFPGSIVTGPVRVKIDALSGLFILIINFTFLTGAFYGREYMKAYKTQTANLSVHCISLLLAYAGLTAICAFQNAIAFITSWEIMALASFILVIFEHHKNETLNAGINFLIQSHICILLLTLGFIWVSYAMNSYDFAAITAFSASHSSLMGAALFFCFFTGFAIKAGFVPFHTWLPYAHPAAPSHVSGIMSGVIIKIGIYGILRMLLLIKTNYLVIGYIVLFFSLFTGIYGVMLAIVQHNLKRLLAYHSIENIGIIGMGIGLGCIGAGKGNAAVAFLGFGGAMLHTLNHSLFKSLLFYAAGNVYQATHTMDIEKMGGLGRQMQHTALLFLIASLAICGLPPFNGFVSEFLIYAGMLNGLHIADKALLSWMVVGLFGLSLIGGLAMLCFTKAFGTVFSGVPRFLFRYTPHEADRGKLAPMYTVVLFIMGIGLFPGLFISMLAKPIGLFISGTGPIIQPFTEKINGILTMTGICAATFLLLAAIVFLIRRMVTRQHSRSIATTWGCGYTGATTKMQYTASSFIRAYRKLAEPALFIHKKKKEIEGIFPKEVARETHPYDKIEAWLIDYPLHLFKSVLNRFTFLQNGNLQFYILYGIVFITLVIGIPIAFGYLKSLIEFLNQI